jgi:succinate dehydrogenase flavin-adding protein (antitoxin of CptAB toxin-antitoxin module)
MTNILKNIVTFGAQGRIDKAMRSFKTALQERDEKFSAMVTAHKSACNKSDNLTKLKNKSMKGLKEIKKLNNSLSVKDREVLSLYLNESPIIHSKELSILVKYSESFTASEYLNGATKGAIAATSSYFLLGDAAAASAGLAASVIAIPALIAIGAFSHISASKKIKGIQEQEYILLQETAKINEKLLEYSFIIKRCDEIQGALKKAMVVYKKLYRNTYKAIYPIPILSRLFKSKNSNLSDKKLKTVYALVSAVQSILLIIESKKA